MNRQRKFLWFLFGLGGQLQLFGTSLCFTELFVYGAAVVLATSEWPHMKRNGATTFFWISIGLVINAALSCLYNHSPFYAVIRGMAVVCLLPCAIIVSHWMLRKDMANFKWSIVGGGLSGFLSTFIFQKSVLVSTYGSGGATVSEGIMKGPLWWVEQIGSLLTTWPKGWYLQFPVLFSAGLPVVLAFIALFTSVSGRGTSVRSLCSAMIVLIGGKKPSQIKRRICKNFWFLCLMGVATVFAFKTFYTVSASSGWLGEGAQKKFEMQTKGSTSIASIVMGGRMESFCGLIACVDRPLIGFGPWALDKGGYITEFLSKYATPEDYEAHLKSLEHDNGLIGMIPCHAYITEFWLWYGIFGLILWLYVMFAMVRYLRQDCYAVPQWFMWLAAGAPAYFWNIFFNPFAGRVGAMMFVVAILMARAVRMGRQPLPYEMQMEIAKVERG